MGDHGRFRHDQDSPIQGDAGAAVRSPSSAPESNSSDLPPPSDAPTLAPEGFGPDAPTILPLSSASPSDSPTLADGASPPPRGGAPTRAVRLPQSELEHGTILAGRYEILQTLGQGGMGAVYKARDLELDRMVALKVIRPDLAKNPAIIDRFKQELRLSQRVTHRNVIRIYDLGEGDGVKFITMEYIEGQDLRTLIHQRKKFPPEEAVAIMEQVCLALDAAHSVGVIHRDLKPQNVMQDGYGPRAGHGFRAGTHVRRRWHDPDRRTGRDDGIHVARAGAGERTGPAIRHLQRRADFLRIAHRPDAVPRRQRSGEPDPAYSGTRQAHFRARRFVPAKPQQHRQQVPGARTGQPLPVLQGTAGGPGSVAWQARGWGHRLRKCEAVGTDCPLAVDRRHRCRSHPGRRGLPLPRQAAQRCQASVSRSQARSRAGDSSLPQRVPGSVARLVRRDPGRHAQLRRRPVRALAHGFARSTCIRSCTTCG